MRVERGVLNVYKYGSVYITYRKLLVYQRSKDFVKQVYCLLKLFPKEEQYALCDQLRRASISIASNIAEGIGRGLSKNRFTLLK